MAFAPYSNDQVKPGNGLTFLLGQFREKDHGHYFEYAERPYDGTDFAPSCPHVVFVGDGERRVAKVLKTVAFIVVGEGADGKPVVERWELTKHWNYDLSPFKREA